MKNWKPEEKYYGYYQKEGDDVSSSYSDSYLWGSTTSSNKSIKWYNTLIPYRTIPYYGIQYSVCRDYNHISRYRGLRQIIHNPNNTDDRFVALETPNPFVTHNQNVKYYEVHPTEENRLDLIANKFYGNPNYGWIISYFNGIPDGYTVHSGQKLMIPNAVTDLFSKGEILQSVSPTALNLGTE